ncbi:MAG: gamma-glutamylcyclotransferase [Methylococcales bacterium]|jgi:gamma-glutamylcyclotransferase (GGCT)/AIG2-like uncharacterized protein YtfP|nr:gamma-glutamylcyclotransferase [Methylococcales bacterium]
MNNIPFYFAYGSNLNISDFEKWCFDHNIKYSPDMLEAICPAILPDMALCFNYPSSSRQCGVLNIIEQKSAITHGMIFCPSQDGWEALDRKEASPFVYEKIQVTCTLPNGSLLQAITYVVNKSLCSEFTPPSIDYFNIVKSGLLHFNLPVSQLEAANGQKKLATLNKIFVYGTLQSGESLHHIIKNFEVIEISSASSTNGKLYSSDADWYPALLIPETYCPTEVFGEVITFNDTTMPIILEQLDEIEGFYGYGNQQNLYQRTILSVKSSNKIVNAWAYVVFEHTPWLTTEISSGSWKKFTEKCDKQR